MILLVRVSTIQQCLLWRSQLTTRFDCVRFHLQTGGNMLLSKQIYHRQLTNNSVSVVTLWCKPEMGERAHLYLSGTEEHPCNRCGKSQPASVKNKRWKTASWNVVQHLKIHLSFQLNTFISWCNREEKIPAMKVLLKRIYVQSRRNLQGTHLKSWWEEGRTDPMHISSVDLDANVAVVHLEEVECALFGADVALAWEWGHSDCVSLLEQGHVVAQGSIHIVLRGKRCTKCLCCQKCCWNRSYSFFFLFCMHQEKHAQKNPQHT